MAREFDPEKGRNFVGRAHGWIVTHPAQWRRLVRTCERCQRMYGRVSRDLVFALCEAEGARVSDDAAFVKAHDLWSALVRYVMRYSGVDITYRLSASNIEAAYPDLRGMPELPDHVLEGVA